MAIYLPSPQSKAQQGGVFDDTTTTKR